MKEEKFFKDSVHGYIQVQDELIWKLIQTPEFQRLRRIHQLGGIYMTFHTAEHSRFAHSLGVYEVARRMIEEVEDINLNCEERLTTLCAALLHDLGHGPFSHAFESVFNFNHENFTERIILEDTNINRILKEYNEDFPVKVASLISKTHSNKIMVSIISSQFDADRLDYLLRDSYNTGVLYGKNDLKRLFRVMRVKDDRIVIKESGLREVENYIIGRYHMYWQVYFHPTSRSFEIVLSMMLKRYKDLLKQNYKFKSEYNYLKLLTLDLIDINDFLRLDESTLIHYSKLFMDENDKILRDLSDRFLNRKLFKYFDYKVEGPLFNEIGKFIDILKTVCEDPQYYIYTDVSKKRAYADLYNDNEQMIYIINKKEQIIELSKISHLVNNISSNEEESSKLYYAFEIYKLLSTENKNKIDELLLL